jgi:hypothetical protein
MFGVPFGESSPFWHAIAREYLERWAHHSQINGPAESVREFAARVGRR